MLIVDWTRRTVTRAGILHYLQVSDYCRLITSDACLVWHNGDLWALQDTDARPTAFGDYFRVAVPVSQGQTVSAARNLLRINENNVRDHRIFESSPEDDDSTFEEMTEESTSTSYGPRADVPEPEPHATFAKIGRHVKELYETSGAEWDSIVLHGLGGNQCASLAVRGCELQQGLPRGAPTEWTKWCNPAFEASVYEILDEPFRSCQRVLHLLIEFVPKGLKRWYATTPVLLQRLEADDYGCPQCTWNAAYIPRGCEVESLNPGTWWIGERAARDETVAKLRPGQVLTWQPERPCPCTRHVDMLWPDANTDMRDIIQFRDLHPCYIYKIFLHHGTDAPRALELQREHLAMRQLLVQVLLDLWRPMDNERLVFLKDPSQPGCLHFTWTQAQAKVRLCKIHIQWNSGAMIDWVVARNVQDWEEIRKWRSCVFPDPQSLRSAVHDREPPGCKRSLLPRDLHLAWFLWYGQGGENASSWPMPRTWLQSCTSWRVAPPPSCPIVLGRCPTWRGVQPIWWRNSKQGCPAWGSRRYQL